MYLVGNRADLEENREVSTAQAKRFAKDYNFQNFFETSALTGHNISELFETITKHLYLVNKNKLD